MGLIATSMPVSFADCAATSDVDGCFECMSAHAEVASYSHAQCKVF